jgi:cell division protein FtsB
LNAFENSIGNINAPTISFLKKGYKPTFLDELIIYLIYLFWWGAQLVLLVVLLNFVIALIS